MNIDRHDYVYFESEYLYVSAIVVLGVTQQNTLAGDNIRYAIISDYIYNKNERVKKYYKNCIDTAQN